MTYDKYKTFVYWGGKDPVWQICVTFIFRKT